MPGQTGAPADDPLRGAAGWPGPPTSRPAAWCGPGRNRHEGVPAWHRTHARGGTVTTYHDHILRMGSQHLAELKRKAAEFERQLWDAHESLDYEMTQSSYAPQDDTETRQEAFRWSQDDYEPDGALPAGPVSERPPVGAGLV